MSTREKLKNLNLDRILDLEEAVEMSAGAREFANEYELLELPVPEWLVKQTDLLREEISRRVRANDVAELQRLETELAGYMSVGEKKTAALNRLKLLQGKLGLVKADRGGKVGVR